MRTIFLIFVAVLISKIIVAQDLNNSDLMLYEDSLKTVFEKIANSKVDDQKRNDNRELLRLFDKILETPDVFEYPFDSLRYLGKIASKNKKVRILTWNLSFNDGTYKYFGYIQYKIKNKMRTFKLDDKRDEIKNPKKDLLTHDKWLGALYYDIVTVKSKGREYYTLLGWDGNDMFSNKKIVEILYFSKSGKPRFGAPLIKVKNRSYRRAIFEYANRASMLLRYFEKDKRIVFDHLSPSESRYEGQKQYYGPDFSYDALEFKKGKWHYQSTINFKSSEKINKKKPRQGL